MKNYVVMDLIIAVTYVIILFIKTIILILEELLIF